MFSEAHVVKVMVVGGAGVGKSSLVHKYFTPTFNIESLASTGQVEFSSKLMRVREKCIRLQICDIPNNQRFIPIINTLFKGVSGILLVYDVSSRASFDCLSRWLTDVKRVRDKSGLVLLLVGNKIDLPRVVSSEEERSFANIHGLKVIETSAQSGGNVQLAFTKIVEEVSHKSERNEITLLSDSQRQSSDRIEGDITSRRRGDCVLC